VSDFVIELDGLRYVWTGSRWYRERDLLTPPIVILRRLDALLPEDAKTIAPLRCPKSLRDSWPDPLAGEWLERYPQLFDADDYRCTRRQPTQHFWEWDPPQGGLRTPRALHDQYHSGHVFPRHAGHEG